MICLRCATQFQNQIGNDPLEASKKLRKAVLKGKIVTCEVCKEPKSIWKEE